MALLLRLPFFLLAVALLVAACSGGEVEGDPSIDAGTPGADAGAPPDEVDAGTPAPDPCEEGLDPARDLPLPEEVRTAAPDVRIRAQTRRLQVYTRATSRLTDAQVEEFRARSCAAFAFDLRELRRSADAPQLNDAVRVVVLPTAAYNAATEAPGSYGVTFSAWEDDGDAFVVPENALAAPEELDDTLAHELTHLLQGRFAPNGEEHPWYFIEGQAIDVGALFARERYGRAVSFVNEWIANASSESARTTFTRYGVEDRTRNMAEVGHDQSMSGFFVEYLRVVHEHGGTQGYADAPARLLRALELASGGRTMNAGFGIAFDGLTHADARQAFIDWLDATDADRAGRLVGTVWE